MKLAVLATLFASASAFTFVNNQKLDLGKVCGDEHSICLQYEGTARLERHDVTIHVVDS
jgi:hypothetical protein